MSNRAIAALKTSITAKMAELTSVGLPIHNRGVNGVTEDEALTLALVTGQLEAYRQVMEAVQLLEALQTQAARN